MEVEQKIVSFPMDDKLPEKVNELVRDGWQLNPSAPAVAVYHLMREKRDVVKESIGKLLINENLIHVIKAGQSTPT